MSGSSIYDDVTRLGPPPPVYLTPCGVPIGRGRVYLTAEQLARLDPYHIDGFAGGGGASEGYYLATGRHADKAWNHDLEALAMHRANHPFTQHFREDIRRVKWREQIRQLITSAWFSPDCKDFSKAKGGKPKSKRIRGLAWTVIHMINELGALAPLVLYMENVEEFAEWCPLLKNGTRNKKLLGWFFRCFIGALQRRGYVVEFRELRACEHSRAPTIRKRLYLIARRDGQPIVWPEHLFGEGKPNRQGIAADILDFSRPCPSIFMTRRQARAYTRRTGIKIQRPLAKASLERIAKGVGRYVIDDPDPFLISLTHHGIDGVDGIREAFKTITGANRGEKALIAPCLAVNTTGHRGGDVRAAANTVTDGGHHVLVSPMLAYGQHGGRTRSAKAAVHTLTASPKDTNQVAAVHLAKMRGNPSTHPAGKPVTAPIDTLSAGGNHFGVAAVHVAKMTTGSIGSSAKDGFPTVTAGGWKKRPGGNPPLAVISTFLAQNNGGMVGHRADEAVSTIAGKGSNQSIVAMGFAKYYGTDQDPRIGEALHSITTKDRFAVFAAELGIPVLTPELAKKARRVARFLRRHGVKVEGEFAMCGEFVIVDIGMRMLTARELYLAQGFGPDYIIDFGYLEDGTKITLTKTAQVKMCGNSVCPPMAETLFRLNLPAEHLMKEAA